MAALVAVPGLAVCWNMIPKSIFAKDKVEPSKELSDVTKFVPVMPTTTATDVARADLEPLPAPDSLPEFLPDVPEPVIKLMAAADDDLESNSQPIATSIPQESVPWHPTVSEPLATSTTRNYSELEARLRQLDARYYRLEKWGNQGELFRFSCYVSTSGSQPYQKHFQAIDSDELRVMETVIQEIEQWKRASIRP